jgi:tetratricopeptide (TPR) repeat protein
MRTVTIVALLLPLAWPGAAGAQERLADQLRKGVVQEEANGSLEKAIPIYQAIVAQFDQDRQAAATALFRLAECYRKSGKREPAVTAYQRVVREFGDQAALVESSRNQLAAFGVTDPRAGKGSQVPREDYVKVWQELADRGRELDAVNARLNAANARLAELNTKSAPGGVDITDGAPVDEIGAQVAWLDKRVAEVQAKVKAGVLPQSELEKVTEEYQLTVLRYSEARRQHEVQQKLTQQTVKSVEAEIQLVQQRIAEIEKRVAVGVVSANDAELLQLKRDLLSLQRKLAELQAGFRR